jgi:ATP-dependent RNA helicase DOB1
MSGRAGRRGLDDRGIVIMMITEQMEPAVAKEIVRGQQDNLNSAFHLGYNMILNLMRVEGISPEFMLERCFFQFQSTAGVSNLEKQLAELEHEKENTRITDETNVKDYYNLRQQLDLHTKDMRDVIMHPNYCLQFLQGGRLVKIKFKDHDFGWGSVVSFTPRKANKGEILPPQESYIVDVLIPVDSETKFVPMVNDGLPPGVRPPGPGDKGKMEVVPVVLNCIESIGHLRVFLPNDLKSTEQRNNVRKALGEIKKRFPDGIAILDPIENMNIKDDSFKRLLRVRISCCSVVYCLTRCRKSKCLSPVFFPTLCTTPQGCPTCTANTHRRLRLARRLRTSRRRSQAPCR